MSPLRPAGALTRALQPGPRRGTRLWLVAALALGFASPARAQSVSTRHVPQPWPGLTTTVKTASAVKAVLANLSCANSNASVVFVQLFDTTAAVVLGTTVPKGFVPLAPSTSTTVALDWTFFSGLKFAATTTAGGLTAPGSAVDCTLGLN